MVESVATGEKRTFVLLDSLNILYGIRFVFLGSGKTKGRTVEEIPGICFTRLLSHVQSMPSTTHPSQDRLG